MGESVLRRRIISANEHSRYRQKGMGLRIPNFGKALSGNTTEASDIIDCLAKSFLFFLTETVAMETTHSAIWLLPRKGPSTSEGCLVRSLVREKLAKLFVSSEAVLISASGLQGE